MSRQARKSRIEEEREKEYQAGEDDLWVPPALKKRLKENGYSWRWLRVHIRGNDRENAPYIARRLRQGYTFLKPEEAPEWVDAPTAEYGRHGSIISVGDLAFAIVPTETAKQLKARAEAKAEAMRQAIRNQLMAQNDRRLPIEDNSRSRVTGGTRAVEFDD
jgi:hypothetical protein